MNQTIFLTAHKAQTIFSQPEQCALLANLTYVNDAHEGYRRTKQGKGFVYHYKNKKVVDKEVLARITALVIPPAWTNVWICHDESGHIQATGFDQKNRKQYRYHARWNEMRNLTKFSRLYNFGELLPQIRKQIEEDITRKTLDKQKVLATVIQLMEETYIRVGNHTYEMQNGSYGLTTFKDKHVKIQKDELRFSFKGKKGVYHEIKHTDKKLARIVKQCRDIPGQELFQYYDENHIPHRITSDDVNAYLKNVSGTDFTAKDFRTWAGTVHAIHALMCMGSYENESICKKNVVAALDYVSTKLGNTRSVCKKYYVHPIVFTLYQQKGLTFTIRKNKDVYGGLLSKEEQVLLSILKVKNKN